MKKQDRRPRIPASLLQEMQNAFGNNKQNLEDCIKLGIKTKIQETQALTPEETRLRQEAIKGPFSDYKLEAKYLDWIHSLPDSYRQTLLNKAHENELPGHAQFRLKFLEEQTKKAI